MKHSKFHWTALIALILISPCLAQNESLISEKSSRIGFNYGIGNVQSFPFKSESYIHDTRFYKLKYNHTLGKRRKWTYALTVEPALYLTRHYEISELRLQKQAQVFEQTAINEERTMREWVLNIGFQLQFQLGEEFNTYVLASVGPTYNNQATKRLNRGFAFSDILGLGFNWRMYATLVDLRFCMRHVSNAGLNYPNRGYNTSTIEIGFSLPL